jgi:hypothetical protein
MLIKQPQINIISRDVTLPSGEFVRAFFVIITIEGVQEIKFLGTKPIVEQTPAEAEVLLLENTRISIFGDFFIPSYFEAVSPFYTLDFLTSQLARAPSVVK